MIASSGHTMEYVGSGTDYSALPENGGVPDPTDEIIELNGGKVWAVTVNDKGTFKAGETFEINQQTGAVSMPAGATQLSDYVKQSNLTGEALIPAGSTDNVQVHPLLATFVLIPALLSLRATTVPPGEILVAVEVIQLLLKHQTFSLLTKLSLPTPMQPW